MCVCVCVCVIKQQHLPPPHMTVWLLASIAVAYVVAIACPAYGETHEAFYIDKSRIHGLGAFTARSFPRGAPITVGISLFENVTNDVCPWVNHCAVNPSAVLESDPAQREVYGTVWLMATRDLQRGDEITVDYNQPAKFAIPAIHAANGDSTDVYVVDGVLEAPGKDYVRC